MLRLGDKLYYNYKPENNHIKYGMYEISSDGSNRLYYPGFHNFPYLSPLYGMQSYQNDILISPVNTVPYGSELSTDKKNYIVKYNLKKQAFELTDILNGFDDDTVDDFFAIEDKIYLTGKKSDIFL